MAGEEQQFQHQQQHRRIDFWDKTGILLSSICFLHCLLTPLLIIILPSLSMGHGRFHIYFFFFVFLSVVLSLGRASFHHKKLGPIVVGLGGTILLGVAIFLRDHTRTGFWHFEEIMTMLGSLSLLYAHWQNRKLQKSCCKHH